MRGCNWPIRFPIRFVIGIKPVSKEEQSVIGGKSLRFQYLLLNIKKDSVKLFVSGKKVNIRNIRRQNSKKWGLSVGHLDGIFSAKRLGEVFGPWARRGLI